MDCKEGCMDETGNVAPQMEKLITPHSEQMLIDMRNDGVRPKANTPKLWHANTERRPKSKMGTAPPGWGKRKTPYI